MRFEDIIDDVIKHEGGFQDDFNDRGNWETGQVGKGELKGTKYGISAMSYPHLDIRNLSIEQAKEIYYQDYWCASFVENLPNNVRGIYFDSCVNHGIGRANKFLQRVIKVKPDGVIGKKSKYALRKFNEGSKNLKFEYTYQRFRFYFELFKQPRNWRYAGGWIRRTLYFFSV